MAHHLIYIPRAHEGDRGEMHPLARVGLADHVAGQDAIAIGTGPDGSGGSLYAWRTPYTDRRLHFNADDQVWIPAMRDGANPEGRYWVGLWKDSPPVEKDLRRPNFLPGVDFSLGGQEWMVPSLGMLPKKIVLAEDSRVTFSPKLAYQAVAIEAYRWISFRRNPANKLAGRTLEEAILFCVRVLALNYRIPKELVNRLELFDTSSIADFFFGILDIPESVGE